MSRMIIAISCPMQNTKTLVGMSLILISPIFLGSFLTSRLTYDSYRVVSPF